MALPLHQRLTGKVGILVEQWFPPLYRGYWTRMTPHQALQGIPWAL